MKSFFLCLAFLSISVSFSQSSDFGNWLIYIGNKKINDKWNFHNEIQYRNYNLVGDLEQLLLRGGVGFNIHENINLLQGYGFIKSENYIGDTSVKFSTNEHRLFQQIIIKNHYDKLKIDHRYRIEERFVEDEFKVRFRYFLSFKIPIKNRFYISLYDELFINSKKELFDRNRFFAGFGYKFNENIKLETGYMTQLFLNGSRDQFNILLFYNF
jgi:hypothetical protein